MGLIGDVIDQVVLCPRRPADDKKGHIGREGTCGRPISIRPARPIERWRAQEDGKQHRAPDKSCSEHRCLVEREFLALPTGSAGRSRCRRGGPLNTFVTHALEQPMALARLALLLTSSHSRAWPGRTWRGQAWAPERLAVWEARQVARGAAARGGVACGIAVPSCRSLGDVEADVNRLLVRIWGFSGSQSIEHSLLRDPRSRGGGLF